MNNSINDSIKANYDKDVFDAVMNLVDEGIAHLDDLQSWVDSFVGFYDSEIDFAQKMFDGLVKDCPDRLMPDDGDFYEYARNLFYQYDYEYCKKTGAVFEQF